MNVPLRILRLEHAADLLPPSAATEQSAGLDLRAAIDESLTLCPAQRALVPTGFAMQIPRGWEGQVRPRSGLAYRHGVTVANAPGTIDSDYRGEVKVLLIHHGDEPLEIRRGDRIAQLVLTAVATVSVEVVDQLSDSDRGGGGFGSTGVG